MAIPKKKNNFISYEIERLNKYYLQLQTYLDKHPPDKMIDRIEILTSTRGNPMIKVIASIEDQLKVFTATLEKLPKILSDINTLRKEADGTNKEVNLRGGQEQPGFMDNDNDEIDFEEVEQKGLPAPPEVKEDDDEEFDDPEYFED